MQQDNDQCVLFYIINKYNINTHSEREKKINVDLYKNHKHKSTIYVYELHNYLTYEWITAAGDTIFLLALVN